MSEKPKPTTTDNTTWHTPMSEDEIDVEIQAHRREKRSNPVPLEVEETLNNFKHSVIAAPLRGETMGEVADYEAKAQMKATAAIQAKITEAYEVGYKRGWKVGYSCGVREPNIVKAEGEDNARL